MKKIEDYLHLYLGCDCAVGEFNVPHKLTGISYDDQQRIMWTYFENTELGYAPISKVKPILRELSSMTEEELKDLLWHGVPQDLLIQVNQGEIGFTAKEFLYLLSKGFDLFGLVDAGLAISSSPSTAEQKIK